MSDFKEGDLVQLKSGGPAMTVQKVNEFSEGRIIIDCQWFVDEKLQTARFDPTLLVKAGKEPNWVADLDEIAPSG